MHDDAYHPVAEPHERAAHAHQTTRKHSENENCTKGYLGSYPDQTASALSQVTPEPNDDDRHVDVEVALRVLSTMYDADRRHLHDAIATLRKLAGTEEERNMLPDDFARLIIDRKLGIWNLSA